MATDRTKSHNSGDVVAENKALYTSDDPPRVAVACVQPADPRLQQTIPARKRLRSKTGMLVAVATRMRTAQQERQDKIAKAAIK